MADKVKIELDRGAVQSLLLRGEGITAMCQGLAQEKASRLGAGYEAETFQGGTRVVCMVKAASEEARRDNLANNSLLKNRR